MRLAPSQKFEPALNVSASRPLTWPVPEVPTMGRRILNALGSLVSNFKWLGMGNVPGALKRAQRKRLTICEACEFQRHGICTKCGCVLKVKTWLHAEKCPIGLW